MLRPCGSREVEEGRERREKREEREERRERDDAARPFCFLLHSDLAAHTKQTHTHTHTHTHTKYSTRTYSAGMRLPLIALPCLLLLLLWPPLAEARLAGAAVLPHGDFAYGADGSKPLPLLQCVCVQERSCEQEREGGREREEEREGESNVLVATSIHRPFSSAARVSSLGAAPAWLGSASVEPQRTSCPAPPLYRLTNTPPHLRLQPHSLRQWLGGDCKGRAAGGRVGHVAMPSRPPL